MLQGSYSQKKTPKKYYNKPTTTMEPTTTLQEIHHHWKPITKPIATKPKSCNKTQRTFSVNKQGKNWLNGTNKQNSMKRKTQQIKFIWRFKPKSQLAIKNNDKKSASQLKILIQNKPSQSKYPLTKPPNSQISARKKKWLWSMWLCDHPLPTNP